MPLAKSYPTIDGFRARYNSKRECAIVELDYWADPAKPKDGKWANKIKKRVGPQAWKREYMRDWSSAAGTPFYPEFTHDPDHYIKPVPAIIGAPIDRGWDFGFRKPSVTFSQRSPVSGRIWFIREILPSYIGPHELAELVLWLSGQIPEIDKRNIKALQFADFLLKSKHYPVKPPWFPQGLEFRDFSGPEANHPSLTIRPGDPYHTQAQILASRGIILRQKAVQISDRESSMRRLLLDMPHDGEPGVLFDPMCYNLIRGMNGGIAYPKATAAEPSPSKPHKDGWFDNIHDAAGYMLAQVSPATDPLPLVKPRMVRGGETGRELVPAPPSNQLDLKETRGKGFRMTSSERKGKMRRPW